VALLAGFQIPLLLRRVQARIERARIQSTTMVGHLLDHPLSI
jgi:hypothetical protein